MIKEDIEPTKYLSTHIRISDEINKDLVQVGVQAPQ
jgi:hypothetical protein